MTRRSPGRDTGAPGRHAGGRRTSHAAGRSMRRQFEFSVGPVHSGEGAGDQGWDLIPIREYEIREEQHRDSEHRHREGFGAACCFPGQTHINLQTSSDITRRVMPGSFYDDGRTR